MSDTKSGHSATFMETKPISWEEEGNIEQINYGGDVYITHSLNCPNCNVDLGEHYLNTLKEVETRAEERSRLAGYAEGLKMGKAEVLLDQENEREPQIYGESDPRAYGLPTLEDQKEANRKLNQKIDNNYKNYKYNL
jgi:hypothetical protein